jgi:hypothetical protein
MQNDSLRVKRRLGFKCGQYFPKKTNADSSQITNPKVPANKFAMINE